MIAWTASNYRGPLVTILVESNRASIASLHRRVLATKCTRNLYGHLSHQLRDRRHQKACHHGHKRSKGHGVLRTLRERPGAGGISTRPLPCYTDYSGIDPNAGPQLALKTVHNKNLLLADQATVSVALGTPFQPTAAQSPHLSSAAHHVSLQHAAPTVVQD